MMRRLAILVFILTILNVPNILAQDGWLMQDGDAERTAYLDTDMKPPFELSGTLDLTEFAHDFTYAYGMIYLTYGAAEGNFVAAFDPETEEIIWRHKIVGSRGAVGCFPVISESLVYAGGQQNDRFYALDRVTGDSIWSFPSPSNYGRTFAIKNDRLFVNPSGYGLVCLQKDSGALLWEYGKYAGQTVPLVDEKHAYFIRASRDTIIALTHDGEESWKYPTEFPILGYEAMLSKGDTVYVKSRGHMIALNRTNGEEYWSTKLASDTSFIASYNAITWTPEVLVVHEWKGDWRGGFMIQGFDKSTGKMVWSHDLKEGSGMPSTAFGKYLVNVNGGDLQIRNASDGKVVQEFTDSDLENYNRVVVVDGMIMALSNKNLQVYTPMTTGVQTIDEFAFNWKLLGNPVTGNLTLEISSEKPREINYRVIGLDGKITGVNGRIFTNEKSRLDIDVSNLSSGKYIIQLHHQGQFDQKKFIITEHP